MVKGRSLFIIKGFHDVTIEDIIAVTELNRYALYNAFGGKVEFFRACVIDFCETAVSNLAAIAVDEAISPGDAARRNLYAAAEEMTAMGAGCIVTENMSRLKFFAPDLEDYCLEFFRRKEAQFCILFERARKTGQLAAGLTPKTAATSFMIFKFGLSVQAKRKVDKDQIKAEIDSFVDFLIGG